MRIGDGDLLLHIKKRRVKGAVIHRVVRDLLRSGIAVIRRDGEPLQVKLIFAFVIGIARVFKRDVRQFFGFERDGEHTAVTFARACDGHNDVLLGIQYALIDLADRVVRDLHGKIAVRPIGGIIILADCLAAVIELYLQPCEVKLGLAFNIIRARGRGEREVFGLELNDGDVLTGFNIGAVNTGQALMGKVPHRCAARGKTRNHTVVVHARYAVLLITAGAVPVGFPRSAAVIIGHAPMHVFDIQARRGVGCRVGDGEVPDDIVTACNGSRYQFTENAAIDRNMRADGYPADCGGDRRIAAVPRVRTTGVHPRDHAVFIDRDGSWIGRSPDYGIQQCRVIIGRLDITQLQLNRIALCKAVGPTKVPIDFKRCDRITGVHGQARFQHRFPLCGTGVDGHNTAGFWGQRAVGGQGGDACIRRRFRRCPDNLAGQRLGNAPFTLHIAAVVQAVRGDLHRIVRRGIVRDIGIAHDLHAGNDRVEAIFIDLHLHRAGNAVNGSGDVGFAVELCPAAAAVQTRYKAGLVDHGDGRVGARPGKVAGIRARRLHVRNGKLRGLALVYLRFARDFEARDGQFLRAYDVERNRVGHKSIRRAFRVQAHGDFAGRGKGHKAVGRDGRVLAGLGIKNRAAHRPFDTLFETHRRAHAVQLHRRADRHGRRHGVLVRNMHRGRVNARKVERTLRHDDLDGIARKHRTVGRVQRGGDFDVHVVERFAQTVCQRFAERAAHGAHKGDKQLNVRRVGQVDAIVLDGLEDRIRQAVANKRQNADVFIEPLLHDGFFREVVAVHLAVFIDAGKQRLARLPCDVRARRHVSRRGVAELDRLELLDLEPLGHFCAVLCDCNCGRRRTGQKPGGKRGHNHQHGEQYAECFFPCLHEITISYCYTTYTHI